MLVFGCGSLYNHVASVVHLLAGTFRFGVIDLKLCTHVPLG
jgi:hypothetical protein